MKHEELDKARQNFNKLNMLLARKAKNRGLQTSLCLYDFLTKQWIEKDADNRLYPASLIKILYLLTVLDQVEQGVLALNDSYTFSEQDKYAGSTKVTGAGSLQFTEAGGIYTVEELLKMMISASDNVAANIVLDLVGPQAVAAMTTRLGLSQTRGTRKMYALDSPLPPNSSTARELTELLIALENREVCGEKLKDLAVSMMLHTENKNRIGRYLKSNSVLVANKVGTVDHMVGDMALIYFPSRPPVALTIMVTIPPCRLAIANALARRAAARTISRLASLVVKELQK
ncbi:MAG TPA: serine hydrolase [Oscillospiraceae bacterium]|nr:serine hydrolase [Oscillospiraceae bacterium]